MVATPIPQAAESRRRQVSGWAGVGLALLLGLCVSMVALELRADAPKHDFISYWATARLMAAHGNPYDTGGILQLENGAGGQFARSFLMRNPPWALLLVLPLGWLPVTAAALLWTAAVTVAGLASVRLLRPAGTTRVPLNALFFAPVIGCIAAGQTATFLLLGISLFLYFEKKRPFVAGLALVLPAIKPHLFLLFWPLLLLDCLRRRQYRILAGGATALACAMGVALWFDPHVWGHYLAAVRGEGIEQQFLPNLSCALRALRPDARWLQGIPTLAGLALVLWYWVRHRDWDWKTGGAFVLAASVLTAPYSWPTDAALFLPAVLAGYRGAGRGRVAVLTLLNVLGVAVFVREANLSSPAYLWLAPGVMAWCLWTGRREAVREKAPVAGSLSVVNG